MVDNFAEVKVEAGKADVVVVEATKVKVDGSLKQVEVTLMILVYVMFVVLLGIRPKIARIRKSSLER